MTDALLAELRLLLANTATAGAVRPRLVVFQAEGEIVAYLQADAEAPGETWTSDSVTIPTAAAWSEALEKLSEPESIGLLVWQDTEPLEITP